MPSPLCCLACGVVNRNQFLALQGCRCIFRASIGTKRPAAAGREKANLDIMRYNSHNDHEGEVLQERNQSV